MRKEFMKAAKCVGKYLSVAALSFALVACGSEASAENGQNAKQETVQEQVLPFPDYPAKFEGCIDADAQTLFAVSRNEGGLTNFGLHPIIQTPKDGVHSMVTVYHPEKDYGYILSDKADGKWCVSEKLTDYTFKAVGDYDSITIEDSYTTEQCNFTARYSNTCGTFNRLATALTSKGFEIDFQAVNENGHVDTLLSGNGKSYRLTTNSETGATVITGNATQEFVFHKVPTKQSQQMLARN